MKKHLVSLSLTVILLISSSAMAGLNSTQENTAHTFNVGPQGGVFIISDSASPLNKLKLKIPVGALDQEAVMTISPVTEEDAEERLQVFYTGSNMTFLKGINIGLAPSASFKKPIQLFIPHKGPMDEDVLVVKAMPDADIDSNGSPDQILVDAAKKQLAYLVTTSKAPFPGIISEGTYLFLKCSNKVTFLTGKVLNTSGKTVKDALAASVQGSGIFALTKKDGTFTVNVDYNDTEIATVVVKDINTGLYGYYRTSTAGQALTALSSQYTFTMKATRRTFSSKQLETITLDWVNNSVSNLSPSLSRMLYDAFRSIVELWLNAVISAQPNIPIDPPAKTMCTGEQYTFTADLGTYYDKDLCLALDPPHTEGTFNIGPGLPLVPLGHPNLGISLGLSQFKIHAMGVEFSLDNENIARIVSQGQDSSSREYNATVEAVGKGNNKAQLTGTILKLASTSIGLSVGFNMVNGRVGFTLIGLKWWPFLKNLGLQKIGPSVISVVESFGIGSESPIGEIAEKFPIISAAISHCKETIDTGSIEMLVDGEAVSVTLELNEDWTVTTVSYQPSEELAEGEHTVRVAASIVGGTTKEIEWTFKVVSKGDICGSFDFAYDYPYGSPECSFALVRTGIEICANNDYPDEITIISNGLGSSGPSDWRDFAYNVEFQFTFSNLVHYPYNIACMFQSYYAVPVSEVNGYIHIEFSESCSGATLNDKVTLSNMSINNGIEKVYPGFILDCDTAKVLALGFKFEDVSYTTELGGSVSPFRFSMDSH